MRERNRKVRWRLNEGEKQESEVEVK